MSARMSEARQATLRGEIRTGCGYRPARTPAHHVERATGMTLNTCGRRRSARSGNTDGARTVWVFSGMSDSIDCNGVHGRTPKPKSSRHVGYQCVVGFVRGDLIEGLWIPRCLRTARPDLLDVLRTEGSINSGFKEPRHNGFCCFAHERIGKTGLFGGRVLFAVLEQSVHHHDNSVLLDRLVFSRSADESHRFRQIAFAIGRLGHVDGERSPQGQYGIAVLDSDAPIIDQSLKDHASIFLELRRFWQHTCAPHAVSRKRRQLFISQRHRESYDNWIAAVFALNCAKALAVSSGGPQSAVQSAALSAQKARRRSSSLKCSQRVGSLNSRLKQ